MSSPDSSDARLVRDFVPALAAREGVHLDFDVAPPQDLEALLRRKFVEEITELGESETEVEALNRLVSLYELLSTLADRHSTTMADLGLFALRKHMIKGGFTKGFVVKES